MDKSERHVNHWDVRILRDYTPFYFLGGGRYDPNPLTPIRVEVSVEFDDNTAALDFEAKVRDLLEKA